MMSTITKTTAIIPTTKPALKIPSTAVQLLKQNNKNVANRKLIFFILIKIKTNC
jgi:hypothetical protein